jgi:hypothetical protein
MPEGLEVKAYRFILGHIGFATIFTARSIKYGMDTGQKYMEARFEYFIIIGDLGEESSEQWQAKRQTILISEYEHSIARRALVDYIDSNYDLYLKDEICLALRRTCHKIFQENLHLYSCDIPRQVGLDMKEVSLGFAVHCISRQQERNALIERVKSTTAFSELMTQLVDAQRACHSPFFEEKVIP